MLVTHVPLHGRIFSSVEMKDMYVNKIAMCTLQGIILIKSKSTVRNHMRFITESALTQRKVNVSQNDIFRNFF